MAARGAQLGRQRGEGPASGGPDRREESARQVEVSLRSLKEGLIEADWHTAMRRIPPRRV